MLNVITAKNGYPYNARKLPANIANIMIEKYLIINLTFFSISYLLIIINTASCPSNGVHLNLEFHFSIKLFLITRFFLINLCTNLKPFAHSFPNCVRI